MSAVNQMKAHLLLGAYRDAEIRRLDDKAALMRAGRFGDQERQSDTFWAARNNEILERVEALAQ